MWRYRSPSWLPDGHSQTIFPSLVGERWKLGGQVTRSRLNTPDGDFVDVDWDVPVDKSVDTALVVFHGLEGSAQSHYAKAFRWRAKQLGWAFALPHFRGCSGEDNLTSRAYHSGDSAEIDWLMGVLPTLLGVRRIVAVGVSLGGNALARWVAKEAHHCAHRVMAAATVCAPLDLAASAQVLDRGINRMLYVRMFLQTLRAKAHAKWRKWPHTFDLDAVMRASTLRQFDDAFTAPVHGFRSAVDYWEKASAGPLLHAAAVPLLVLNARNDPFVPADSLPRALDVGSQVEIWQTESGGHVGFPGRHLPLGRLGAEFFSPMPVAVCEWLKRHVPSESVHG